VSVTVTWAASRLVSVGIVLLVLLAVEPSLVLAQAPEPPPPPVVRYGDDGLEIGRDTSPFRLTLGGRLQFRYAAPFVDDPLDPEELGRERETLTNIRRARFRAGGHLFTPRLTFAFQYDLVNTWLLDARLNYEVWPWLQLRAGQWKADYNRERVASSGEQLLVERSIVNQAFTIDRQNGVMVHGRAAEGRPYDSTYFVGVFNGGGRSRGNDDRQPLWVARYQWNALGDALEFSAVDLARSREVRLTLAAGASGNQTANTTFSSSGPGQIPGIPDGEPGRYRLAQWVGESALHWRGISAQHEYHWKRITDTSTGGVRRLEGFYVQAGLFPHEFLGAVPRPFQFTGRFATVDPNLGDSEDHREEITVGANWFLNGHRSKISADASRLRFDTPDGFVESSTRYRLQWDVSF
jgi:phosphate-selective porin OprO and OprP